MRISDLPGAIGISDVTLYSAVDWLDGHGVCRDCHRFGLNHKACKVNAAVRDDLQAVAMDTKPYPSTPPNDIRKAFRRRLCRKAQQGCSCNHKACNVALPVLDFIDDYCRMVEAQTAVDAAA